MKRSDPFFLSANAALADSEEARQVRAERVPLYAARAACGREVFTGRVPLAPREGRPLPGSAVVVRCPLAALEAWASSG